eukprot:scaffold401986_cov46-Prasinocladus_malaysianus.AAC.1
MHSQGQAAGGTSGHVRVRYSCQCMQSNTLNPGSEQSEQTAWAILQLRCPDSLPAGGSRRPR